MVQEIFLPSHMLKKWQNSDKLVNYFLVFMVTLVWDMEGNHYELKLRFCCRIYLAKNCGFRQSLFLFLSTSKKVSLSCSCATERILWSTLTASYQGFPWPLWDRNSSAMAIPRPTHINHFNEVKTVILVKSMVNQLWNIRTRCWMELIIFWRVNWLDLFI